MSTWAYVLYAGTVPIGELVDAKNKKFSRRLGVGDSASFSLLDSSRLISEIHELETDLVIFRNGGPIFRGRIGPTVDEFGGSISTDFTVWDYRSILGYRLFWSNRALYSSDVTAGGAEDKTYTTQDPEAIAWNLISMSQSGEQVDGGYPFISTGGLLRGFTEGMGAQVGINVTRTMTAGQTVGSLIDTLSQDSTAGFDWAVVPCPNPGAHFTLPAFCVWPLSSPRGGTNSQFVLEYGGNVSQGRRVFDPKDFANVVRGSGGTASDGTTTAGVYRKDYDDTVVEARGRWEVDRSWNDVVTAAALQNRSLATLAALSSPEPSFEVSTTMGVPWDPAVADVGALVNLVIKTRRFDTRGEDPVRVTGVDVTIDEDTAESVTYYTGPVILSEAQRLRQLYMRQTIAERRLGKPR